MQVGEGLSGSFVVLDELSEALGPSEGSLDDPSSWEQNEAPLCLGQFITSSAMPCSAPAAAALWSV
jgi:hypothetical protein